MYLERGYREREIPGLVLSKNLHGMEIDPRAAQIARLALAMCARGLDRRFFGRGVQADIAVLAPVALGEGDVPQGSALAKRKDLLDALAHLDEAGSLLAPGEGDLAAIREAIELTGDGGLFGSSSRERLQRALETCEVLSRRHDCVVANPPYMGSSSFGPFMSRWVKKNYPDVKSDLCTCFIERGFNLTKDRGYAAMITMQSWMFLGSFEKMRSSLIGSKSILSMLHLGPRAFDAIGGEVVNVTADVVYNGRATCEGAYVRLVDINGSDAKRQKALEAIGNPDCDRFYRRDAETFKQVPGTPIAYWLSDAAIEDMASLPSLSHYAQPKQGMVTRDNKRFMRSWWEIGIMDFNDAIQSHDEARESGAKWLPCTSGGQFRKWYGNNEDVIFWENDGAELIEFSGPHIKNRQFYFLPAVTWSSISSGAFSTRYVSAGYLPEHAGNCLYTNESMLALIQGIANSSIAMFFMSLLAPSLNFNVGDVARIPIAKPFDCGQQDEITNYVRVLRFESKTDWDSLETSWDFKRHPLL